MGLREISEEAVSEAVRSPDRIVFQNDQRTRCVKYQTIEKKEKLLVVVVEKSDAGTLIITAFLTSKVHKYLS